MLYNHLNMPSEIKFNGSNTQKINYTYSADGIKLRKATNNGGTISTTDYAGNFVYENNTLKQFFQEEGYVEPKGSGWQYVYQYKDIWGNIRLTYADDNSSGSVTSAEIRREQNYYPFGLEHKGYNFASYGAKNNLKTYQGQEFTEDLGLNTHEWKYRMSDPSIGRFWQIDPLAEDYTYNSTYAFAENKLGSGVELEGLEITSFDHRQTRRDVAVLKGEISKEQYLSQGKAEGNGALTGLSILMPGPEDVIIAGVLGSKLLSSALGGLGRLLGRSEEVVIDAAEVLSKNKEIGKKGEEIVTESLKKEFKGDEVLEQVTGKFGDGTTTRFDNVVVDPKTGKAKLVNETKTGNADYTTQQKRFHTEGESTTLTGKKAGSAQGQTINTSNTTTRTTRVKREDIP